ncbi:MAG: FprA family A-type flavoprotein [Christensenellales bacterium]
MLKLKDNIYYVGVQDESLRTFDIIMNTPYGTTYNAYVIKGTQKVALVEAAKLGFADEYFRLVEEVVPIAQVDYLIINHTEPDHAGSIPLLLERNPDIEVVGTNSAIQFITNIIKRPFKQRVVRKGDSLDLGGRTLHFYPLPNLHWPDTMFTWDEQDRALFTCDFFGAHFAYPDVLLSRMADRSEYRQAQYQYFGDIMAPFIDPFVINGLKQAQALGPEIICTGHGPVLDTDIAFTFERYQKWSERPKGTGRSVAILYVSAYDYTRTLAETIARTLREEGVDCTMLEASKADRAEVMAAVAAAKGLLFGSPTFLGDMLKPIGEILAAIYPFMVSGKPGSAFGSYGWSGEAVPNIIERLKQLKMKTVDGIRFRLRPSEQELEQTRAFAREFAKLIK